MDNQPKKTSAQRVMEQMDAIINERDQKRQAAKNKFKNKPVTFNTQDPDEAALLAHAEKRTNFSRYVKSLIQKDRDGWSAYVEEESSRITVTQSDAESWI